MKPSFSAVHRRRFRPFLVGSPYVAALGGIRVFAQRAPEITDVIARPKEALSVMDFEDAARRKALPGHWAYMISGGDDDGTIRANRNGYQHVQLRPRRLCHATKADMRTDSFGTVYNLPIFTCPTGRENVFDPEDELAVARATKARDTTQMLSTSTSTGVEDVNAAHGSPVWYQLCAPSKWKACEKIVRRVEAAGCPGIALTVDNTTGRNSETYPRIDMTGVATQNPAVTWEFVDQRCTAIRVKLFVTGIDTREDVRLAVENGLNGILVSNHGGRCTETLRSPTEALPEVVAEVGNRIPVFVDGGVRRGMDVFKALALGAKAGGIGRPFLWGLGAFGQAGVDRVLEILQGELTMAMGNCGALNIASIDRSFVATPDWRRGQRQAGGKLWARA